MSDDRGIDPRFDAAFQRGYQGATDAPPPASRPAAPAIGLPPVVAAPVAPRPEPQPVPEADEPRRRNPFLIVLAVLSLLLIGGGLYVTVRLRDLFADTQSSTQVDFVTLQLLVAAAPIAIGLGVATALGILFLLAVRWGRSAR